MPESPRMVNMSEYIVGGLIGYCLSLVTILMVWALCVVAKVEDDFPVENCPLLANNTEKSNVSYET